jgi:hypothetical protein
MSPGRCHDSMSISLAVALTFAPNVASHCASPDAKRRFLSPRVQGQFSLRQNRNHVHIVQTKVGVLSCLTRKCQSPSWFPISPSLSPLPF